MQDRPEDRLEGERDLILVRRVGEGDREALGELVGRHQDAVFRYLRSLGPSEAAAEDALQTCFLDVMRGARGFRGESGVRSWLFTLARHAAFRQRRLRAGEPRQHDELPGVLGGSSDAGDRGGRPTEAASWAELGVQAGFGAEDPESVLLRSESAATLRLAIDALEPEDREVLVLRDLEDMPGAEAAALLGLSLAALKSRLHRARLRLAARLREELPDGV